MTTFFWIMVIGYVFTRIGSAHEAVGANKPHAQALLMADYAAGAALLGIAWLWGPGWALLAMPVVVFVQVSMEPKEAHD